MHTIAQDLAGGMAIPSGTSRNRKPIRRRFYSLVLKSRMSIPEPVDRIYIPFFNNSTSSGYDKTKFQAERQRLFVSRAGSGSGSVDMDVKGEVEAVEIGGQFLFDAADHGDFLGSILGTGVTRDGVRRF